VLGSNDFITVALLGINEGVAFVGGGGGFGGSAAQDGFYEAQKSLGGKLADAAVQVGEGASAQGVGGFVTDAVFEAFKTVLEQLNSVGDCRGVAFAHGISLNRKTLLAHTLTSKSFLMNPASDEVGLAAVMQVKQGCGHSDYDIPVRVFRSFDIKLEYSQRQTAAVHLTDEFEVVPQGKFCETLILSEMSNSSQRGSMSRARYGQATRRGKRTPLACLPPGRS
jgi:hypothetical protein